MRPIRRPGLEPGPIIPVPVVNNTAAPASRNIDIGGYGSRLKAGTTQ
jgi:hypothetical protein